MSQHVISQDAAAATLPPVARASLLTPLHQSYRKPDVYYHDDSPSLFTPILSQPLSERKVAPPSIPAYVEQPPVNLPPVAPLPLNLDEPQPNVAPDNVNVALEEQITMAEDRILLPQPFRNAPDDDPSEFWRRLNNYTTYKGSNAADKLRLAKAMFTDAACDWLENLPDDKKDTFQHLEDAFKERFVQPAILRFRSAREIFGKKQAADKSVDIYVNRLRALSKKVEIDDNTLLYALLSGLKPKIASFVIGKNPQTYTEAIDQARIAEYSLVDSPPSADEKVTDQLADIRKDIQRLAQRYDSSVSLSAAIQNDRSPSLPRRVTFQQQPRDLNPRARPFSPRYRGSNTRFQQPQFMGPPNFRGRYVTSNAARRTGTFIPRGQPYQFQSQMQQTPATEPHRCGKCGRNAHTNVLFCPVVNQACGFCGKLGHFRVVCRQAQY